MKSVEDSRSFISSDSCSRGVISSGLLGAPAISQCKAGTWAFPWMSSSSSSWPGPVSSALAAGIWKFQKPCLNSGGEKVDSGPPAVPFSNLAPLEVFNAGTQASHNFQNMCSFTLQFICAPFLPQKLPNLSFPTKFTKILKVTSSRQFNHEKHAKMACKSRSKICSSHPHT